MRERQRKRERKGRGERIGEGGETRGEIEENLNWRSNGESKRKDLGQLSAAAAALASGDPPFFSLSLHSPSSLPPSVCVCVFM